MCAARRYAAIASNELISTRPAIASLDILEKEKYPIAATGKRV